ncbi:hypothetical protein ABC733_26615 [Mangrovibacter sp. SLW1]
MVENVRKQIYHQGRAASLESDFAAFLTKYNDFRLNELAQNNINIENNFWKNTNLKQTTSNTIQGNITAHITHDAELIDVICNYYAYYLRNNTLHGEQPDHSFRFIPDNKEEKSLKFTCTILFAVVCDLINSHSL